MYVSYISSVMMDVWNCSVMWVLYGEQNKITKCAGSGTGDEREQDGSSQPPFIPTRALGPGAPVWTAISFCQAFNSKQGELVTSHTDQQGPSQLYVLMLCFYLSNCFFNFVKNG